MVPVTARSPETATRRASPAPRRSAASPREGRTKTELQLRCECWSRDSFAWENRRFDKPKRPNREGRRNGRSSLLYVRLTASAFDTCTIEVPSSTTVLRRDAHHGAVTRK